jgi:hypothetical protein
MSEKEERILITTRHKNDKLNMTFTDMYKEYTRQDAIRKMCDAYFKAKDNGLTESERVEAALNALLKK